MTRATRALVRGTVRMEPAVDTLVAGAVTGALWFFFVPVIEAIYVIAASADRSKAPFLAVDVARSLLLGRGVLLSLGESFDVEDPPTHILLIALAWRTMIYFTIALAIARGVRSQLALRRRKVLRQFSSDSPHTATKAAFVPGASARTLRSAAASSSGAPASEDRSNMEVDPASPEFASPPFPLSDALYGGLASAFACVLVSSVLYVPFSSYGFDMRGRAAAKLLAKEVHPDDPLIERAHDSFSLENVLVAHVLVVFSLGVAVPLLLKAISWWTRFNKQKKKIKKKDSGGKSEGTKANKKEN